MHCKIIKSISDWKKIKDKLLNLMEKYGKKYYKLIDIMLFIKD